MVSSLDSESIYPGSSLGGTLTDFTSRYLTMKIFKCWKRSTINAISTMTNKSKVKLNIFPHH